MHVEVVRLSTRRLMNGAALLVIACVLAAVDLASGETMLHVVAGVVIGIPVVALISTLWEIQETAPRRLAAAAPLSGSACPRPLVTWAAETLVVFGGLAAGTVAVELLGNAVEGAGSTLIMSGIMCGIGGVHVAAGIRIRRYERRAQVELLTESRRFKVAPSGLYARPVSA